MEKDKLWLKTKYPGGSQLLFNGRCLLHVAEPQLLSLISDLFIAGGETTITTLRWAVLCLALYPDVQERIRNELKETIGLDSPPRYWLNRLNANSFNSLQLTIPRQWYIINRVFDGWISAIVDAMSCLTSKRSCTKCYDSVVLHRVCGGTRQKTLT